MKLIRKYVSTGRHVSRSENLGGRAVLGGDNVPPLVEIGLTDLPKSGGRFLPCCMPDCHFLCKIRH